jgi:hypothetical protein
MEELFTRGIMKMGPAHGDPDRQVGTFNPEFVKDLPPLRTARMNEFRWIEGEWTSVNNVPATAASPAYRDVSEGKFRFCENGAWICMVARDGKEIPHITYDPFSKQWIYVLMRGAFGMLRAPGWVDDRIEFTGLMTMIGVECEWRITWTKISPDEFRLVNEEKLPDGSWVFVDDWEFRRKAQL